MGTLKEQFISGISWTFLGQFCNQVISLLVTVVLARLLSPTEFGLVGMVTVFTGFAKILIDFGLGNALIYKDDVNEIDKSTVFWGNLLLSLLVTGIYVLLAGVVANFYGEPALKPITIILSSLFVLNSISIVNSSILRKNLDFKTLFKINLISQVVAGVTAVAMAIKGLGYWAIVFQLLVSATITSCLSYYFVRWVPGFRFSKRSLTELFRFSWGLIGNNSLNYWVRNIDNLLVGKFIGSSQLGIYSRSYIILTLPMRNISDVVSKVLFPSFTKLKDSPAKIKSIYFRVCRSVILIVSPLMVFLFVYADLLVGLVFGDRWNEMIPIIRVFSILAINQSIGTLISNLYMAHGKTKEMFVLGTILRCLLIASIVFGLRWGIVGVALSYTIASYVSSYVNHFYVGKISGFTMKEFFGNISPVLVLNLLIALALVVIRQIFVGLLVPYVLLGASFILHGCLYLFALTISNEPSFIEIKAAARKIMGVSGR